MFFCEPCRVARDWPESWGQSSGQCEVCENFALCWDVRASDLPKPKPTLAELLAEASRLGLPVSTFIFKEAVASVAMSQDGEGTYSVEEGEPMQ